MDVLHSSRATGAATTTPARRKASLLPDAVEDLLELLPRHLLLSPARGGVDVQAARDDDRRAAADAVVDRLRQPAAIGDAACSNDAAALSAPLSEVAQRTLQHFMSHTQALAGAAAPPPLPSIAPLRVNMPASGAAARLAAHGQPPAPWPLPPVGAANFGGAAPLLAGAYAPHAASGRGNMHTVAAAAAAPVPAPAPSASSQEGMLALATWHWAAAALAQPPPLQPSLGIAAGQISNDCLASTMINNSGSSPAAAAFIMHAPPSAPRPAAPAQPAASRHLWLGNVMVADAEVLARVFAPYGPLESVRAFSGRTYAFVNFERARDAASAKAGLEMSVLPELTGAAPLLVRFQLPPPEAALYARAGGV